jgi:hypothetical protein
MDPTPQPGPTPTPEGTPPPAETPPAPQYVTPDQLAAIQAQQSEAMAKLTQQNADLMSTVNSLIQNQNQPPAPSAPAPQLTGREIDEMITNGEGGEKILSHFNQTIDQKLNDLKSQVIDPLRQQGGNAIASLAQQNAKNNLPYYRTFEKEIDAYIQNNVQPELRSNPQVYQFAHDAIVGQNVEKLMELKQQEILRQQQDADVTPQATPPSPREEALKDPSKVPPPEEYFDARALDLLRDQNVTADQHAQKMGFKDYANMYYYSNGMDDPREVAEREAAQKGAA